MNNYGVRTTEVDLKWNWNAPLYFGLNVNLISLILKYFQKRKSLTLNCQHQTINVNGVTTTMVGSCLFGQQVVDAMRDSIEGTLREIMAQSPEGSSDIEVPQFSKGQPEPVRVQKPEQEQEQKPEQEPESKLEQEPDPEQSSA